MSKITIDIIIITNLQPPLLLLLLIIVAVELEQEIVLALASLFIINQSIQIDNHSLSKEQQQYQTTTHSCIIYNDGDNNNYDEWDKDQKSVSKRWTVPGLHYTVVVCMIYDGRCGGTITISSSI